jgi:hypothetical protein
MHICGYMQHKLDQMLAVWGVQSKSPTEDLIIIDILENLAIPNVSTPPTFVPAWNSLSPTSIGSIFYFVGTHVHDSGAILLFHANSLKTKVDFKGYLKANDFIVFKEWMEINHLCLISGQEQSKTVSNLSHFSQLFPVYHCFITFLTIVNCFYLVFCFFRHNGFALSCL